METFDFTQLAHAPLWVVGFWLVWTLSHKALETWRDVASLRLGHERAQQSEQSQERRELVAHLNGMSNRIGENTSATRDLTLAVREWTGRTQLRQG